MEKYEIIKELGAGSFGVAHLCRDKQSEELFAIKFIERGSTIDENVKREIINHRRLEHKNIIRFKEVILTPTHLALVMEYASGGELFERISQLGPCTEDEARYFFRQLISGINYIHSKEICHRDLKLDNILLDGKKSPNLKICDFGYSKRTYERYLKPTNAVINGKKSTHMMKCDFRHSKQICNRDLMIPNKLSEESPTPQLKQMYNKDHSTLDNIPLDPSPSPHLEEICNRESVECQAQQLKSCDSGKSKLHSRPYTKVGSATYTAPEILSGRGFDGKMADVWSCGVTLYVMLVAAYPFDDPNDYEKSEETIKRIIDRGYEIPDNIQISKECQHLLSSIFVQNPSKRISIKGIMSHPWFTKNLGSNWRERIHEPCPKRDNPTFSRQSIDDIIRIVLKARKPAQSPKPIMGYKSNTEKDHETTIEEGNEDQQDE